MKKVWMVSSGSYSDYSVSAVFETEAQADRAAEAANTNEGYLGYFVEERPWYPEGEEPEVITLYRGSVVLLDDGTHQVIRVENPRTEIEFVHFGPIPPRGRALIRQVRAPIYKDKGARLEVVARTPTLLRKALNDRVMEHKALGPRRVPEINP